MPGETFALAYALSYALLGVLGFLLAGFVYFYPHRNRSKTAFAAYLFAVGWWGIFSVPMIFAPNEFWGTFWDRLCLMGLVFIPVGFVNFNFIFLELDKKYRPFLTANYLLTIVFFGSIFTPYFLPGTSPRFGLNYFTDPGPLYYVFFVFFVGNSVIGIVNFFFGYIKARGNRRQQLFNIFWSSLLGYALGGLNYNVVFRIPPAALAIAGNCGIIFHMLVYAYTITKQRVMDISVVISRAVAELLTVIFHGAVYGTLVILYKTFVSAAIDLPFVALTVAYGVIVGQTHQDIRLFLQTTSDKLFLRGHYDYYRELSDASTMVGRKLSLPEILKVLYDTFFEVVEVSEPRVFLPENFSELRQGSDRFVAYDQQSHAPLPDGPAVESNGALARELLAAREPLANVKEINAALVVPCLLEDRLIAFFALGHKLSEDAYTDEDLRLLKVLANQVAISLDHSRSYEKIKAELEVAERQLERSQRLASLGTLTAGVTHEIRNPLTVVRAETERLPKKPRDQEYLQQFSELVLKHIDRVGGIVERMLGLAKEKPKREVPIDLNEIVTTTLPLCSFGRIKVITELGEIPPVIGDREAVQEIFVNLLQNAIEAMPDGGTLTLRSFKEDHQVNVEVSDTGKGIPGEIREKIFDPFFSTRHEGVGLGLSIVYRIVREHGGDIKVSSEEGKGSTFRVSFSAS